MDNETLVYVTVLVPPVTGFLFGGLALLYTWLVEDKDAK